MCEKTASGTIPAPADQVIKSPIADCQRSGVFINGSNRAATVTSNGVRYALPVGKALTIPVGSSVRVSAQGDGPVVWTLTTAVLPAQVSDGPELDTTERGARVLLYAGSTGSLNLGSGSYTKLIFLGRPSAGGIS